jgi:hypothetical protein
LSDSELDDEEQLMLLQQQGLPPSLSASASVAPATRSALASSSTGTIERGTLAGALDMDFIAAVIAEKARAVAVAAAAAGMQPKVTR